MYSAIVHADACCALGDTLDQSVDQMLAGRQSPQQLHFDSLQDPVTVPYYGAHGLNGPQPELRIYQFLQDMVERALTRLALSPQQRARTGLFIGSSSFDINVSEARYQQARESGDQSVPMAIIGYGKIAARLQARFGLGPHAYTYSTACTSSANALLNAHRLLQANIIEQALVVGVEFFNQTTVLGFHGLGLISPSGRMSPFHARRDGLILGEGCSLLVLSNTMDSPISLCGGAIATDNHSLTAANGDGSTIAQVIGQALEACQLTASDLAGMKVHGTASLMNDEAEAAGIRRLWPEPPPLFALKPSVGHTLGACGALETALVYGCLNRGQLPCSADDDSDADLGVNLLQRNQPAVAGHYALNYFAFGGNNTCLIMHKAAS